MEESKKIKELTSQIEELKKNNEDKDKKISELNESLNSCTMRVEKFEKMASLGEMVAGFAHEINTPVGIGVTAASHLEQRAKDFEYLFRTNAMKRSDLERFVDTTMQSSRMILSNLSRCADLIHSYKQVAVDQSSEQRRAFNMKEYIGEILLSLSPKIKKTNIKVDVSCSDALVVDTFPGALSQIITNLIVNSLVHGYKQGDNGTIAVKVSQDEAGIKIVYTDDGAGISAENLPRIFDPYFTTRRDDGGSGLGMHIIQEIVAKKLGGTIIAESKIKKGVIFTITFPL